MRSLRGKEDTKQRILRQGLNLLSRTGFASVTVGVLAERSGMSKSGLFAHFDSKEGVQLELLEQTLRVGASTFIEPAMRYPPGLERLRAIVDGWLAWTDKAGLEGGCPVAAGLFEYDDIAPEDPVRQHLLGMEEHWRRFLLTTVGEAVSTGELRADLDVEQFVWELCGIYLSHHVSHRFLNDPKAKERAVAAFTALVERSRCAKPRTAQKRRGGESRSERDATR